MFSKKLDEVGLKVFEPKNLKEFLERGYSTAVVKPSWFPENVPHFTGSSIKEDILEILIAQLEYTKKLSNYRSLVEHIEKNKKREAERAELFRKYRESKTHSKDLNLFKKRGIKTAESEVELGTEVHLRTEGNSLSPPKEPISGSTSGNEEFEDSFDIISEMKSHKRHDSAGEGTSKQSDNVVIHDNSDQTDVHTDVETTIAFRIDNPYADLVRGDYSKATNDEQILHSIAQLWRNECSVVFFESLNENLEYQGMDPVKLIQKMIVQNAATKNDGHFQVRVVTVGSMTLNSKTDDLFIDLLMLSALVAKRGTKWANIKKRMKRDFVNYYDSLMVKYNVIKPRNSGIYGIDELTLSRVPAITGPYMYELGNLGIGTVIGEIDRVRKLDNFKFLNHNSVGVMWPKTLPYDYVYYVSYKMSDTVFPKNKPKPPLERQVRSIIQYVNACISSTFWSDNARIALFVKYGALNNEGYPTEAFNVVLGNAKKVWRGVLRRSGISDVVQQVVMAGDDDEDVEEEEEIEDE